MLAERRARLFKPRKAARWTDEPTPTGTRDDLPFRRWHRATPAAATHATDTTEPGAVTNERDFSKYDVQADAPVYDDETYEKHLANDGDWSREETDYLIETYKDCSGKWPVVHDRYEFPERERSMEDLKKRFYTISATLLSLRTPIASMGQADYQLYETLVSFNPEQEKSRKRLAEGHLYRKANEVDEETVLLGELQRIMLHQATLDNQREELRRRLDYPHANTSGMQYTTSQSLTNLWQQLLAADRMKKTSRMRPTGNAAYDGFPSLQPTQNAQSATSATQSQAQQSLPPSRRPTRDSLPSATPATGLPMDLSQSDRLRYGVTEADGNTKLPSGITFASDKLHKPRIAKSTIQTEKIAAILLHIGVPELIPLPTLKVIESFDQIMSKVHALLEMRKIAEKEEQELKTRQAELGQ